MEFQEETLEQVDILIKNGRVVDPSQGMDATADVAIKDGRVCRVGDCGGLEGKRVLDAKGKIVTPGLIDFHAHIYHGGSDFCAAPDSFAFACGVTTMVDAGSAGVANYGMFRMYAASQLTRIRSLLNVCPTGLGTLKYHENVDPAVWDRAAIRHVYEANRDHLLGLKVRQSSYVVNALGLAPLKETLKLAEEIGCRVVVHVTEPPCPQQEIADLLRPDDVFCHVFQGSGPTIIEGGKVHPAMKKARERGVLFDASNGMGHFNFGVARTALGDGFAPDILSTDMTTNTLYKDYVFGLPYLMAKYLHLGMTLPNVVRMTTANPARAMGMAGRIGTLKPGAEGDVCVLEEREMSVAFMDTQGNVEKGERMLVPKLTLQAGHIRFRSFDFMS